jgi:two-component system, NarL family, sensor kinase
LQIPEEDIILIVGGITFVIAILGAFFFILIIRNFNARRRKQKEIFEAVLNAQEDERQRIAKDLHDEIGPMLSAVKLNIGRLNSKKEPQQVTSIVKEAQVNLDTSIQDVRRISHNLVPRHIELHGLAGAINDYISYVQKAGVVFFTFTCTPENISFSQTVDTNLYRVMQELINNAIRHGDAKKIDIEILQHGKEFSIFISDDGNGFSEAQINEGIGLKSIRSRVGLYDGYCNWQSGKDKGTKFKAVFNTNNFR